MAFNGQTNTTTTTTVTKTQAGGPSQLNKSSLQESVAFPEFGNSNNLGAASFFDEKPYSGPGYTSKPTADFNQPTRGKVIEEVVTEVTTKTTGGNALRPSQKGFDNPNTKVVFYKAVSRGSSSSACTRPKVQPGEHQQGSPHSIA